MVSVSTRMPVHWIFGIYSPNVIRARSSLRRFRSAGSRARPRRSAISKKRFFSCSRASRPDSISSTITRFALVPLDSASDFTRLGGAERADVDGILPRPDVGLERSAAAPISRGVPTNRPRLNQYIRYARTVTEVHTRESLEEFSPLGDEFRLVMRPRAGRRS